MKAKIFSSSPHSAPNVLAFPVTLLISLHSDSKSFGCISSIKSMSEEDEEWVVEYISPYAHWKT